MGPQGTPQAPDIFLSVRTRFQTGNLRNEFVDCQKTVAWVATKASATIRIRSYFKLNWIRSDIFYIEGGVLIWDRR